MAEILTPGSLSGMNQTPTSPVLASVNGKPITAEDVDRFIAAMGRNGQAYNNPQGRAAVLEQLCAPETGLLPAPADWKMRCTCPDWTEPCPHAAAAIYAAGCLVDTDPSLLFTLRCVDPSILLAAPAAPASPDSFDAASLGATFGIDLDFE